MVHFRLREKLQVKKLNFLALFLICSRFIRKKNYICGQSKILFEEKEIFYVVTTFFLCIFHINLEDKHIVDTY